MDSFALKIGGGPYNEGGNLKPYIFWEQSNNCLQKNLLKSILSEMHSRDEMLLGS